MFNSTYGAGFRAGMCPQPTRLRMNGTRVLVSPRCPFPAWRFISNAFWWSGYLDGKMKRLSSPIRHQAPKETGQELWRQQLTAIRGGM